MKLIITGATGYVATELILQSLHRPEITSVVAVSRKTVSPPANLGPGADASKLHSVTVEDYDDYPDSVRDEFEGANACIWTVAFPPYKSRSANFSEVTRVSQHCTLEGLKAMAGSGVAKPFRFLYMGGAVTDRMFARLPRFMSEYFLMRTETDAMLLALAAGYGAKIEACIAKPGFITNGWTIWTTYSKMVSWALSYPRIDITELSTALLDQVTNGFEKKPLQNDDMLRIARRVRHGQSSG
ncbi:hypothetical protein N431DRAFT_470583 [Stipitochalara longipes BDJ]|nr:hypothetical protein N431DRAFT_470583 [Stipitochalara longipes BDJ]